MAEKVEAEPNYVPIYFEKEKAIAWIPSKQLQKAVEKSIREFIPPIIEDLYRLTDERLKKLAQCWEEEWKAERGRVMLLKVRSFLKITEITLTFLIAANLYVTFIHALPFEISFPLLVIFTLLAIIVAIKLLQWRTPQLEL